MKKWFIFSVFLLVCSVVWAQDRHALLIGNTYPHAEYELHNVINDIEAVSSDLRELGFQVVIKQNLRYAEMVREIDAFITRLKSNINSEGFLWYAGHGMEIQGDSCLLPLDVNLESESMIIATSYSVNNLTRQLNTVRNRINIIVVDACRVPPAIGGRIRSMEDTSRLIRPVQVNTPDLFIFYSASSGTIAYDSAQGRKNSPFVIAFLKHIKSTEPLTVMVGHVITETINLTERKQRPDYRGSMSGNNIYYTLNPAGYRPNPLPDTIILPDIKPIEGLFGGIWTAIVPYNGSFDTYEIIFGTGGRCTIRVNNRIVIQETVGDWLWDGTFFSLRALFRNAALPYQNFIQWTSVLNFVEGNGAFNILATSSVNGELIRFTFIKR